MKQSMKNRSITQGPVIISTWWVMRHPYNCLLLSVVPEGAAVSVMPPATRRADGLRYRFHTQYFLRRKAETICLNSGRRSYHVHHRLQTGAAEYSAGNPAPHWWDYTLAWHQHRRAERAFGYVVWQKWGYPAELFTNEASHHGARTKWNHNNR